MGANLICVVCLSRASHGQVPWFESSLSVSDLYSACPVVPGPSNISETFMELSRILIGIRCYGLVDDFVAVLLKGNFEVLFG